jgi:hypothetical protein
VLRPSPVQSKISLIADFHLLVKWKNNNLKKKITKGKIYVADFFSLRLIIPFVSKPTILKEIQAAFIKSQRSKIAFTYRFSETKIDVFCFENLHKKIQG